MRKTSCEVDFVEQILGQVIKDHKLSKRTLRTTELIIHYINLIIFKHMKYNPGRLGVYRNEEVVINNRLNK